MENQALAIIDMLYSMIAEAWGVPLGNDKCIVERDKALGLLDDLKAVLPVELSEARRLVNARDEFVNSAKQEAESLRRSAQEEAERLVEKQSVLQAARDRAEEIVSNAEQKSKSIYQAANSFLDDALRKTEEAMDQALEGVRSARSQFRAATASEPVGRSDVTLEDVEDIDLLGQ